MGSNINQWSKEEDKIIKENYQSKSDKQMEKLLPGRTSSSIYARRHFLGLNKESKKFTYDDVVAEMDKRDYILLSGRDEYQNCQSKMRYICPNHKDMGEQKLIWGICVKVEVVIIVVEKER